MTETFSIRNRLDQEFESESDRGCAILTLCLLEEALFELLAAFLPGGAKDARHFMPKGRMTFGLANAHKLGLISDQNFKNFKILIEVRNSFAHGVLSNTSFTSDQIRSKVSQLELPDLSAVPDVLAEMNSNPRKRFMMCIDCLAFTFDKLAGRMKRLQRQTAIGWTITRPDNAKVT